jgi:hypothetical protein
MASTSINKVDRAIETHAKPAYVVLITVFYIIYVFIFLGISYIAPQYIRFFGNLVHIMLAIILIIKFNPVRSNPVITSSDSALIFGSAVFILINVGVTEFAMSFFDSVKSIFNIDMSAIA